MRKEGRTHQNGEIVPDVSRALHTEARRTDEDNDGRTMALENLVVRLLLHELQVRSILR